MLRSLVGITISNIHYLPVEPSLVTIGQTDRILTEKKCGKIMRIEPEGGLHRTTLPAQYIIPVDDSVILPDEVAAARKQRQAFGKQRTEQEGDDSCQDDYGRSGQ